MLVTYAARAASASRASFSALLILGVSGCASPNMRFHNGAMDSRVVTASRTSSSVALASMDTLKMLWLYAAALSEDDCATLDDLRKSVETLGSVAPLLTRVFGPSHPDTPCVQRALEDARKALAIRTAASSSGAA